MVVVGLLLLGAGMGGIAWLMFQGGQAYISEQEPPVRIADPTDAQYQAVLAPFVQAMSDGQAATLTITPDDFNVLVARNPAFDALRGRLFLTADGDHLVAEMGISLAQDDTHPRFCTDRATLDASYASNGFVLFLRHLEPLDHTRANTRFTQLLNSESILTNFSQQMSASLNDAFNQQADKDPATADFLHRLRTVVVQDGKIVVTLDERPGIPSTATPAESPSPTPVASGDDQT